MEAKRFAIEVADSACRFGADVDGFGVHFVHERGKGLLDAYAL